MLAAMSLAAAAIARAAGWHGHHPRRSTVTAAVCISHQVSGACYAFVTWCADVSPIPVFVVSQAKQTEVVEDEQEVRCSAVVACARDGPFPN